ncbi:MAG: hypothetical protein AAGA03_06870 [Planctomycetota bacterium]
MRSILFLLASTVLTAGVADAGVWFNLKNHPDGNAAPPTYGLRLDGLAASNSIFTFDFDHVDSDVKLHFDVDANTIQIAGQAYGGRDAGGSYANDSHLGVYDIEFTYGVNVTGDLVNGLTVVPEDRKAPFDNIGRITAPGGTIYNLIDEGGRNDENDAFYFADTTHRGHVGWNGWGWLNHVEDSDQDPSTWNFATDYNSHIAASDWLFTAEPTPPNEIPNDTPVPEPGAIAIFGLFALTSFASRSRRGAESAKRLPC